MAAGFGLLFLAQATGDGSPVSRQFLGSLTASAGSPLFLTICSLAGFYAYAWLRGVKFGEWGCLAMLALAMFVKPASLKLGDWSEPQLWALRTMGLLEFFLGLVRVDSKRCFVGVTASIAAFALSPDLPQSALVPAGPALSSAVVRHAGRRRDLQRRLRQVLAESGGGAAHAVVPVGASV